MGIFDGLLGGVIGGVTDLLNFSEQKKQNAWEREAQETTWEREDNAVQRRAADMKAAGINPLLAAGSAAQASGPINIGAPQMGSKGIEGALAGMSMMKMKADVSKTAADTQVSRINADLAMDMRRNVQQQIEDRALDMKSKTIANTRAGHDLNLILKSGLRSDVRSYATEVSESMEGLETLFKGRGGSFVSTAKEAGKKVGENLLATVASKFTAPFKWGGNLIQEDQEARLLEVAKKLKPRGDGRIR